MRFTLIMIAAILLTYGTFFALVALSVHYGGLHEIWDNIMGGKDTGPLSLLTHCPSPCA